MAAAYPVFTWFDFCDLPGDGWPTGSVSPFGAGNLAAHQQKEVYKEVKEKQFTKEPEVCLEI